LNWHDHRILASSLRDQGLADLVTAKVCLNASDYFAFGRQFSHSHVVVSMGQQSIEKVTKGYLLWHTRSFDPTKGHRPFTLSLGRVLPTEIQSLLQRLNRQSRSLVNRLRQLEAMSPQLPMVADEHRGQLQPLNILERNSEYPFWQGPADSGRLVTPAEGMSRSDAVEAIRTCKRYLDVLAQSDPRQFTNPIQEFLNENPIATSGESN
jgi:hypothetical protein